MHGHVHSGGTEFETPLVVFAVRSNVGKSSTIRALTGRKLRVGKKPGSTRWELMIDLGPVTLVDIPGFGHMSGVSKTGIENMKTTIIQKLEGWSDRLALAVLIVDISLFRELVERWETRGEIPIDLEFYSFLSEIAPHVVVAANKIDKLKKRERSAELEYLTFKLRESLPEVEPNVVPLVAYRKQGIPDLKHAVETILMQSGLELPEW
jgi:GTP-binding protein EngB required for normal cell division